MVKCKIIILSSSRYSRLWLNRFKCSRIRKGSISISSLLSNSSKCMSRDNNQIYSILVPNSPIYKKSFSRILISKIIRMAMIRSSLVCS